MISSLGATVIAPFKKDAELELNSPPWPSLTATSTLVFLKLTNHSGNGGGITVGNEEERRVVKREEEEEEETAGGDSTVEEENLFKSSFPCSESSAIRTDVD